MAYKEAAATASAIAGFSVELNNAGKSAIEAWRGWPKTIKHAEGGWDWEQLIRRHTKDPTQFRLAIWADKTLCGLAAGQPSSVRQIGGRSHLRIDYIEGCPDPGHPLKGSTAAIVIDAANAYATLLEADLLRVTGVSEPLVPLYESFGFKVASGNKRPVYLEREVIP